MGELSIRSARPDDAPALAAAERLLAQTPGQLASTPDEITDEGVRAMIMAHAERTRGIYLVAERDGVLLGQGILEALSLAAVAHVVKVTLAVHEGHQGQGIGRTLMNVLLHWARANPAVEKVELQVRSSNGRAIELYRSLGFVEEGRKTRRIKLPSGKHVDDIYMALWVGRDVAVDLFSLPTTAATLISRS